jgi:hypothetical protein
LEEVWLPPSGGRERPALIFRLKPEATDAEPQTRLRLKMSLALGRVRNHGCGHSPFAEHIVDGLVSLDWTDRMGRAKAL